MCAKTRESSGTRENRPIPFDSAKLVMVTRSAADRVELRQPASCLRRDQCLKVLLGKAPSLTVMSAAGTTRRWSEYRPTPKNRAQNAAGRLLSRVYVQSLIARGQLAIVRIAPRHLSRLSALSAQDLTKFGMTFALLHASLTAQAAVGERNQARLTRKTQAISLSNSRNEETRMTKTLLSAALIAGFGIAAFAPQAANASDGTISFTGAVTAASCTIKVNGTAAPYAVVLPTVATTALSTVGATAGSTLFNVALTGCSAGSPAVSKVGVNFEAGPTVNSAGRLMNTTTAGAGVATGVDLQLTDSTGTVINVGSASPTPYVALTGTTPALAATLPFYVRYYAAAATVGAGTLASSVGFSIVYQ